MGVNKVVFNTADGENTLIDLTNDSVTPETLAEGVTAHSANGDIITGTMPITNVRYTEQTLTDEQKAQARTNIGALSDNVTLDLHTDGFIYLFVNGTPIGKGLTIKVEEITK